MVFLRSLRRLLAGFFPLADHIIIEFNFFIAFLHIILESELKLVFSWVCLKLNLKFGLALAL
jgi:hypothetical protein